MRPYRLFLFFGLFTTFFLSGMFAGSATIHLLESVFWDRLAAFSPNTEVDAISKTPDFPVPLNQTAKSTSASENLADARQRNILIIGVDQLNSHQARLESVWLAMYFPNHPQVTLMPVFPKIISGPLGIQAEIEKDLAGKFHLDPGNYPDPGFLKALEEKDIWWTNFIVVDGKIINWLLDITAQATSRDDRLESPVDTGMPPSTSEVPLEGLLAQVNIAQEICRVPVNLKMTHQELFELAQSILALTGTDITGEQAIKEIQYLNKFGGRLMCEFPFLIASPVR